MSSPELAQLHGIPADADGPVFGAPWQAQAFAMVVGLQEKGLFSWGEWTEQLARSIAAAQARGGANRVDAYYEHWLAALETLVTSKGLATPQLLEQHRAIAQRQQQRLHKHD